MSNTLLSLDKELVMYLDHFGLHSYPFATTPDPDRFCATGGRDTLLNALLASLLTGEGWLVVLGASGSGKSTLCRLLGRRLPQGVRAAQLADPEVTPETLIPALLRAFRFAPGDDDSRTPRETLSEHLEQLHRKGEQALLLIDDAHLLPISTLERLYQLTPPESDTARIQVLFLAQPGFEARLQQATGHPFRDPYTTWLTLSPLTASQTEAYLDARLRLAGFQGTRLFAPGAVRRIHRVAKGQPRAINRLAHMAMIHAHGEAALQITTSHANRAGASDAPSLFFFDWLRPVAATAAFALLLAVGVNLQASWSTTPLTTMMPALSALLPTEFITALTPAFSSASTASDPERSPRIAAAEPLRTLQSDDRAANEPSPSPSETIRTAHETRFPFSQIDDRPPPAAEAQSPSPPESARIAHDESPPVSPIDDRPRLPPSVAENKSPSPPEKSRTAPAAPPADAKDPDRPIQVPDEQLFLADALDHHQPVPKTTAASRAGAIPPRLQPNDPLEETILASHRWLKQGDAQHYTIQLLLMRDENGLKKLQRQLSAIQPPLAPLDLKVFRLKDGNLLVYLNECSNAVACEALMNRLPLELRSNNPSVRSLARLRSTVQKLALDPSASGPV
ncbi:MAG: AAA family ATPase [Magnetococcales bacterium]|nr:AAA family ATPase [Magnetococcales bacterium]